MMGLVYDTGICYVEMVAFFLNANFFFNQLGSGSVPICKSDIAINLIIV